LRALEKDFADAVERAQEDAYDAIGGEQINLGSPKQLQVVLFDTLGMPKTKRTKTGWTTDAEALAELFTPRPSIPSWRPCCGTATPPGCGSPSRAC
jgi:DNA polymerase-1